MPRNLIYFIPASWIILIPITITITSLVLFLSLKTFSLNDSNLIFKKNFFKVFMTTFFSHILTSMLILTVSYIPKIGLLIFTNQLEEKSIIGYIMLTSVIFLGIFINFKLLEKTILEKHIKDKQILKYISMVIAIISAPYILFVI